MTRTPSSRRSRAQKRVVESPWTAFSDGGTGMFRELYASLTEGATGTTRPLFLMRDFIEYCDAPGCQPGLSRRAGSRQSVCAMW